MTAWAGHKGEVCLFCTISEDFFSRSCLKLVGSWDELAEERRYEALFFGSGTEDLGLLVGHHPVKEWSKGLITASDFDGDEHTAT